ncbi:MAG: hypothetical protein ACRC62_12225 [Microcoleus sp.]
MKLSESGQQSPIELLANPARPIDRPGNTWHDRVININQLGNCES